MSMLGKLLIAVGSLLLLHAGYYSVQYAEYVKLTEVTDAKMPPFEVQDAWIAVMITDCRSGARAVVCDQSGRRADHGGRGAADPLQPGSACQVRCLFDNEAYRVSTENANVALRGDHSVLNCPFNRSLSTVISSPEFHVFNHRGKALHKRIVS